MLELDGHDSFAALNRLLEGQGIETDWASSIRSIERFRIALTEVPQKASALDLAVMLREVLVFEFARRSYLVAPSLQVGHRRFTQFDQWDEVGLRATAVMGGHHVTATPWTPGWLTQTDKGGVDAWASAEVVCRTFNSPGSEGDPFLASVGRTSYRSRGQRAAVRSALTTPAGATLVVALPTGEGKSMIFQLVQSIGFVGSDPPTSRGVTLVIVPTIALGINHEKEAVTVCGLSKPLAFQGGSDIQNAIIAQRISDGTQGLCFASPEAACGRLRDPLRRAAETGHLRALVMDEAHLVDQWGTGFRTEFQELSGLRRELLAAARPDQRMRTILLSATLTDSSLETLRAFFGTDGRFESIAAVQLRPEPDYWIAPMTDEHTRIARVLETLYHAPRPAVLYVTEVNDAEDWYRRLVGAGFRRVRKLHGKTGRQEREEIVSQWRDGLLDLVVGTSAFGLGIDYPHARSIIHACIPETLDRFYQEVGRGGRDGRAALALIVPTRRDLATARRINRAKVISVDRGFERWVAMFSRKVQIGGGRFAIRIDGRPGSGERDIDMSGEANTDWNLRTVALMAKAGLVRLLGTPYPRIERFGDWLEVEAIDEGHLDKLVWQKRVEPVRRKGWAANERNLELMRDFLSDTRCPAEILRDLYGADRIGLACSRCSICRADARRRHETIPTGEPVSPWSESLGPDLSRLFDQGRRLLVIYDFDHLPTSSSRRLSESLRRLQQKGLFKILILGAQPFDMTKVTKFAERLPIFVSEVRSLAYSRLPKGPEIVLVGRGERLEEQNLTVRADTPRIFLASQDQNAPDGRRLRDVFGGRTLSLDEFHARVAQ